MPIIFNGTNIENVNFNETKLDKVVYNGVTVWENYSKPFTDSTSNQRGGTGTWGNNGSRITISGFEKP